VIWPVAAARYRISYTVIMDQQPSAWEIYVVNEVRDWLDGLHAADPTTFDLIDDAIYTLSRVQR
jgi:hypothetical protein